MSFQKRKTSYRKGVTSSVLDEYPLPEEGESIARISSSRGGNTFEVISIIYRYKLLGRITKWNQVSCYLAYQVQ